MGCPHAPSDPEDSKRQGNPTEPPVWGLGFRCLGFRGGTSLDASVLERWQRRHGAHEPLNPKPQTRNCML